MKPYFYHLTHKNTRYSHVVEDILQTRNEDTDSVQKLIEGYLASYETFKKAVEERKKHYDDEEEEKKNQDQGI